MPDHHVVKMSFATTFYNDAVAVVKEPSRKKYLKVWSEFKEWAVNSGDFEDRMPTEDEFADYFRHIRLEMKQSFLHCGHPIIPS